MDVIPPNIWPVRIIQTRRVRMRLAKAATKVFHQFATAEQKVAQFNRECGALLGRPFVAAGLHRVIESEIDAAVAFEKLAALLNDEKERSAFRSEVSRRASSGASTKQRKRRVAKNDKGGTGGAAS
jgi:hypothetical protein